LDKSLIGVFLVVHDVVATALLIAISWQAVTAWWSQNPHNVLSPNFIRGGLTLSDVVAGLILTVVCLGGILYPTYRISVHPYLELHNLRIANGAFEIKEHFAALAVLMVPAYRQAWSRASAAELVLNRRAISTLMCGMIWWNFLAGHLMNFTAGRFA
jgi:hypothetical protein